MTDFSTMTRMDIIREALITATEESPVSTFTRRAERIELAIRDWERHNALDAYASLRNLTDQKVLP